METQVPSAEMFCMSAFLNTANIFDVNTFIIK